MSEDTASTPQEEALAGKIESTRQQLGETVEALAAKADVKRRAQRRAMEVTGSLRDKARDTAGGARDKARDTARAARDKARAAKGKVTEQQAAVGLRQHRAQVTAAAAVATLVLAWLAMRRLRR